MDWRRRLRLVPLFALATSLGLILLIGTGGTLGHRAVLETSDGTLRDRLSLAGTTASLVDGQLGHLIEDFESLSRTYSLSSPRLDPFWQRRFLRELTEHRQGLVPYAFLADQEGTVLMVEPSLPGVVGANVASHSYMRRTLVEGLPQYSSDVPDLATGRLAVYLTIPIRDQSGKVMGLVGAALDLTHPFILNHLQAVDVGEGGQVNIVDEAGWNISSTDSLVMFRRSHTQSYPALISEGREYTGVTPVYREGVERGRHVVAFVSLSRAPWGISLEQDEETFFAVARRLQRTLIIFGGMLLMVTAVGVWGIASAILDPLRKLDDAMEEMSRGDYSHPVTIRGVGEIDNLATSLEGLRKALEQARTDIQCHFRELQDTQAQLIQAAKLASIGEMAANVAHEINNPLTGILGYIQLMLEETSSEDPRQDDLRLMEGAALRMRDIVRQLLGFARQTPPQMEKADLHEAIRSTLSLMKEHARARGINVVEDYADGLPALMMDANQMKQVFLNLLNNAMDAMPQGGEIRISTTLAPPGRNSVGEVVARVTDTGMGIPTENLRRIFEPFFTTKPRSKGTGLGLAVSLGIVQNHGGRIEVESRLGEGSTFSVHLPLGDSALEEGNG